MIFQKFLIWLVRNIIVIIVATLIFSFITIDVPTFVKGVFGDIFEYAEPGTQKQVVNDLTETCSSFGKDEEITTINEVCANKSMISSMRENCDTYKELNKRNIKIENEDEIRQTCAQIESGELERTCNQLEKTSLMPDFSKIGGICNDYNAGKINDKEFFMGVVSSPFSDLEPDIGFLEKYNKLIIYLNQNKIIYLVSLTVLLSLLYFVMKSRELFLIALSGICFSIGLLILLPYFGILLYDKFIGLSTTAFLNSIFGIGTFDFKAIISVILLMFFRTYNNAIIILGFFFLGIGVIGKVYAFGLKSNTRKIDEKQEIKISAKVKKK